MSDEEDLRRIALSLPETTEKPAWGMPTFRVRGKIFAALNPKEGPGVTCDREERAALAAAEPKKFYWTAHDENYRMLRLHLDAIEADELRELLTDAWRLTAPKSLRAQHDLG